MMYLSSTGRTIWLITIKSFHLPGYVRSYRAVMSSKGPGVESRLVDLSAQRALFQDRIVFVLVFRYELYDMFTTHYDTTGCDTRLSRWFV